MNDRLHTLAPALGAVLAAGRAGGARAGHGHGLHDFADRGRDAVRRRAFDCDTSSARGWPRFPAIYLADRARAVSPAARA